MGFTAVYKSNYLRGDSVFSGYSEGRLITNV